MTRAVNPYAQIGHGGFNSEGTNISRDGRTNTTDVNLLNNGPLSIDRSPNVRQGRSIARRLRLRATSLSARGSIRPLACRPAAPPPSCSTRAPFFWLGIKDLTATLGFLEIPDPQNPERKPVPRTGRTQLYSDWFIFLSLYGGFFEKQDLTRMSLQEQHTGFQRIR